MIFAVNIELEQELNKQKVKHGRNLLRETKEGVWERKSPSGVQGQSSGGDWGQSPQKPDINANFQLRGGYAPMSPLATPLNRKTSPHIESSLYFSTWQMGKEYDIMTHDKLIYKIMCIVQLESIGKAQTSAEDCHVLF